MQQNTQEQRSLGTILDQAEMHREQHCAGVTFVNAGGGLGEGDLGAGDGEGEGREGERMTKRIFSNDAQSCVIVFPSRSYSIAK